ncbi:MAG: hypothetical protein DWQ01_05505 [Planctomycetota bacterium]|nr:MAG: hypothetical protein DWQ01_05505 [Planctomycetota bacterium]
MQTRPILFVITAVLALLLSSESKLLCQSPGGVWQQWQRFQGQTSDQGLGSALAFSGDVNGDGVPDVILGSPTASPGGLVRAGVAQVFSGADQSLLWTVTGVTASSYCGASVAGAGDLNQDGFDDFMVGAPNAQPNGILGAGSVFVLSGFDGSMIFKLQGQEADANFGTSVAGPGDVDGDSIPDLVVGAPLADGGGTWNAGTTFVFSGANGALIREIHGTGFDYRQGSHVRGAGDWNGDGLPEVLTSSPYADPNGVVDAGAVHIISVVSAALIAKFQGDESGALFGYSAEVVGDLNAEGTPDVIIGAPFSNPNGRTAAGTAVVLSGATGKIMIKYNGAAKWNRLGWSVAALNDVNGDDVPDFAAGAPAADGLGLTNAGLLRVYSGRTGELLQQFLGLHDDAQFGLACAGGGDLDQDGFQDLLVGAPGEQSNAGEATTLAFDPFLYASPRTLSSSAGGIVQMSMQFPVTEAGVEYAMLASAEGTGPTTLQNTLVPLTNDVLFRRLLAGNYPPQIQNGTGVLDASAAAVATLTNPPGGMSKFIDSNIYVAVLTHVGGTISRTSAAATIHVTP